MTPTRTSVSLHVATALALPQNQLSPYQPQINRRHLQPDRQYRQLLLDRRAPGSARTAIRQLRHILGTDEIDVVEPGDPGRHDRRSASNVNASTRSRSAIGPSISSSWNNASVGSANPEPAPARIAIKASASPAGSYHLVRDPQQDTGTVPGQRQGRGAVAGQHDTAPRHSLDQRLGRIGEDFAAGAVAQHLGVQLVGQRGQVHLHRGSTL